MTIKLKTLPEIAPGDEELLSRKELAARWRCHIETLKRWEEAGRLKPIKVGAKFLRYRLSDIEKFERENMK
jgi:predicted site-specific integrase-resolvase